jgi:uncharacterized cupredoxin-like copper-binding protein
MTLPALPPATRTRSTRTDAQMPALDIAASIELQATNSGAIRQNVSATDRYNPSPTNLNVTLDTDPGRSGSATINESAGDYRIFCSEPGHDQVGLYGYITVANHAGISGSEAAGAPHAC